MLRLTSMLRGAPLRALPRHAGAALATAAFSSQSHLSGTRFGSLEITENSKRAIRQVLKYDFLTDVQDKTFAHILEGKDVLSKAKTGNGKTMAFLLPTIERMVRHGLDHTPSSIPLLVISPTRELAVQIAVEARKIAQFHDLNVACFVGGTPVHKDAQVLQSGKPVDILVATPGRLLDHIEQDSGNIRKMLRKLQFLVLDEADRLLDMGFRNEVVKILNSVPAQRQTLLFSATLPKSTQELTKLALRKDFELVNTVTDGGDQTNLQVKQEYVVCPSTEVVPTVEKLLMDHIEQCPRNYKVILFFPTARKAQFMAQLFTAAGFKGVLEIHSRKSQTARTKTADKFRASSRVMLFSSDVSARGVDYPDVTLVLQVGLTDRDHYIHRLGRTARGGSSGHGVLVLADFEKPFLNELKGLPVLKYVAQEDGAAPAESRAAQAIASLDPSSELAKSAVQSYQSWLGFYHSNLRRLGIDKHQLVELAQEYGQSIGLQETPKLDARILKKIGLAGVEGIEAAEPNERRGRARTTSTERDARAPKRNDSRPRSSSASWSDDNDDEDNDGAKAGKFASDWSDRGRGRSQSQPRGRASGGRGGDWGDRKRSHSSPRGGNSARSGHGGRSQSSPRRGDRR